jgi:hypothetical protein
MEKHFGEDHKKATGTAIKRGGYPDVKKKKRIHSIIKNFK